MTMKEEVLAKLEEGLQGSPFYLLLPVIFPLDLTKRGKFSLASLHLAPFLFVVVQRALHQNLSVTLSPFCPVHLLVPLPMVTAWP